MTEQFKRTETGLPVLRLRKGKEESLQRFHPWVFSGALVRMPEESDGIEEGDLVAVAASDGRIIGTGHFQIGSIAVRMLSFDPAEAIDAEFFRSRLGQALELRRALGLPNAENFVLWVVLGVG